MQMRTHTERTVDSWSAAAQRGCSMLFALAARLAPEQ